MSALIAERLRVTVLSAPVDEVRMSFSSLQVRRACLVEVEAAGVVGVGESWINYPAWGHRERVATLCDGMAPHVLGQEVSSPADVHRRLSEATLSIGRQWGAPGPIWQAISGVDLALWDLLGKIEGRPVSQLLNSAADRAEVPAYASGVGPERVAEWCERAVREGFGAAKVKLGFDAATDRATLEAASGALGPDVALLADVNQGWSLEQAREMVPLLAKHDLRWLEEPLAGDRLDDLEVLAAESGLPLATGENVYSPAIFHQYVTSRAVSTIQPDLTKCGGLTVAAQVAVLAKETGTALAPHCYGSAVGIAASLQLAAAFPNVGPIELDIRDNPLRTDLLHEPLRLDSGNLAITQTPGLGVELDAAVVDRYRICQEERTLHDH